MYALRQSYTWLNQKSLQHERTEQDNSDPKLFGFRYQNNGYDMICPARTGIEEQKVMALAS